MYLEGTLKHPLFWVLRSRFPVNPGESEPLPNPSGIELSLSFNATQLQSHRQTSLGKVENKPRSLATGSAAFTLEAVRETHFETPPPRRPTEKPASFVSLHSLNKGPWWCGGVDGAMTDAIFGFQLQFLAPAWKICQRQPTAC